MNFTKSLVITTALLASCTSYAQGDKNAVLMTIKDTKVTVAEFENVYRKNNTATATDNKSLNDYIDLFVNFKLKVKEAEELGLDTAKSFKEELGGYRKQLAQPYLTDKDVNQKLLEETYKRLQEDVKASHILVKVTEDALPKDTLIAYKKIMDIRSRILKGEDFNKVANQPGISDDPSSKENGGNLGFFTALQMVYPFENAAYNTKIGEISMPVRTKYGYHIVKVTDRRKAQGEILVSHIMIKTTPEMKSEDSLNAKVKIDEIYAKLKSSEKFDALAQQYSDDKVSAGKGGELPWFGTGKMPIEFEVASFSIQNKGDYSAPMKTKYGWHIILLKDKKALASFDEMQNELKAKVQRDSRSEAGKTSLIAKVKKENKFKETPKALAELTVVVDSSFCNATWSADKAAKLNKPLFNLGKKEYTQFDFAKYLDAHQTKRPQTDISVLVKQMYSQYVEESVVDYEEMMLDQKYPEFKALMQEYRDGILLFELTDQKVWSKAVKDSAGSVAFYEKNKNNYMWDERADAVVYSCLDAAAAKQVRAMLKKGKTVKEIQMAVNKTSQLNLQVEEKLFTKGENEYVTKNWNPAVSADIVSEKDKRIIIVSVNKLMKPDVKSYLDSKGMVTADFQNYLEKEWIDALKKKYPVTIDQKVLSTIK